MERRTSVSVIPVDEWGEKRYVADANVRSLSVGADVPCLKLYSF